MIKMIALISIILFNIVPIFSLSTVAKNEQKIELYVETGHTNSVLSIAFSPNGEILASGDKEGNIKLWSNALRQELKTLFGQGAWIKSLTFSPDGKILASAAGSRIKLWDVASGQELKTLFGEEKKDLFSSVTFSPDGKILASAGSRVKLWDVASGQELKTLFGGGGSVAFSLDGKILASGGVDKNIKLWDFPSGKKLKTFSGHTSFVNLITFSPDGKVLASASHDKTIKLWDVISGQELKTLSGHLDIIYSFAFAPDGKFLASAGGENGFILWDAISGRSEAIIDGTIFDGNDLSVASVTFTPDGKTLASSGVQGSIKLWDVASWQKLENLSGQTNQVGAVTISPNGKIVALGGTNGIIALLDVFSRQEFKILYGHEELVASVAFSPDSKTLVSRSSPFDIKLLLDGRIAPPKGINSDRTIRFWDVSSGKQLRILQQDDSDTNDYIISIVPDFNQRIYDKQKTSDGRFQIESGEDNKIHLYEAKSAKLLASLIPLDEKDWVITTPDGRFDTNKSLDTIEGLHWIVNDEILKPLPLDIFMRQYYEPGLLQRVLAGEQFKPLPSIADINRVQPKVAVKEIKPAANAADLVDVTIEVDNVTDDVSISATDKTKKKQLSSGAFDLRLFRDGQLVGASAPRDKLAGFINDAPRLIAETKASGKLIDTPEDRAWREANDIFKLKSENVKFISPIKAQYTFRSVKLPRDGRKAVEFMAYAFNSDRVKSNNAVETYKLPETVSYFPRQGRAFLVSIGVNAVETPRFNLRFAANDAKLMQETLGERLRASGKYSEVVAVALVSDYDLKTKKVTVNHAQKPIIKAVFNLLSGNKQDVPAEIYQQIPNADKLTAVQPEDTLIIAFSGHGYADRSGVFYLLPYDVGANVNAKQITPAVLQRMISSDELSLWLRDVTAAEMLMIVDACHSTAAIESGDFKPGPMGSRGLGQLGYDKDMKILTATQADNVALESNKLEQGLLSYALLQDGIKSQLSDNEPKDKQLSAKEWLGYAVGRVPQLYEAIKKGNLKLIVDGQPATDVQIKQLVQEEDSSPKRKNRNARQLPHLFDFNRRNTKNTLFNLPEKAQ